MNPEWAVVVVTGVIQLVGMGIAFGVQHRAINDHDKQFEAVDIEQKEQWVAITQSKSKIANLRGHLGLNGES